MSEPAVDFGVFEDDELLDEPVRWRPKPPPTAVLIAGAGALVAGITLGVGLGLGVRWWTAPAPPAAEEIPDAVRVVHALEPVSVNLRGDGGERILQVRVELAVTTTTPDDLEAWSPWLRDSLIVMTSDYTATELLGRPGRERFREELLHRARHVLDGHAVDDVYLTELVVK